MLCNFSRVTNKLSNCNRTVIIINDERCMKAIILYNERNSTEQLNAKVPIRREYA